MHRFRPLPYAALLLALSFYARAQTLQTPSELRASRAFDAAKSSALQLHAFLAGMPKGADLHVHLSGAVYAETFLRDAAADRLCVNTAALSLAPGTDAAACGEGRVPAAAVFKDQKLYDALVDSFSMRGFVPSAGITGHDHFFATFARFGGLGKAHAGEWLDEVASRAAAQNEQYLEIMQTPSFTHAANAGYKLGWSGPDSRAGVPGGVGAADSATAGTTRAELARLRDALLAGGLRDDLAIDRRELDEAEAARREREHCGDANPTPACRVEVRYLYQVLRAFPPQQVFAQTLLGFELASAYPERVVGINFVQPEDAYMAMAEYRRQMLMLDYLHSVYPTVHISLHAGELAPGLVPPEGLRFHIRDAVDLGHAERIGHGVDVMYEDHPAALLKEMAERHVMVEINLTSNDVILGVTATRHSLPAYRAAAVPVALSTDDEGVSRIDLTHEFVRAVLDYNLSYGDLKQMVRTSLEHSFLPGPGLWSTPDGFGRMNAACAGRAVGAGKPGPACAAFLASSPKAAQQWELERRYQVFEAEFAERR